MERLSLKEVLKRKYNYNDQEAEEQIKFAENELLERLENNESPFNLMEELFGLEPDYLDEIMPI